MQMPSAIFICGTDTGVGKTLITAALCAYLNQNGIRAGAFKPLESGCAPSKGMKRHLRRADSEFLKKTADMPEALDDINCYYFKEPLAPGVAAQLNHQVVSFAKIKAAFTKLKTRYDVILVEGAGGLLVPLSGQKTNLDLIKFLDLPVLVIARLGLGTINHTLLTLRELHHHKIPVLGVILNEGSQKGTAADATNPSVLRKYGVPIRGIFPRTSLKSRKHLAKLAKKSINNVLKWWLSGIKIKRIVGRKDALQGIVEISNQISKGNSGRGDFL
jgi:dethiobiotin synthetase